MMLFFKESINNCSMVIWSAFFGTILITEMNSEPNEDPDDQKDRIVEESPKGRFLRVTQSYWTLARKQKKFLIFRIIKNQWKKFNSTTKYPSLKQKSHKYHKQHFYSNQYYSPPTPIDIFCLSLFELLFFQLTIFIVYFFFLLLQFNEELGFGAYKTVYKGYDNDSGCEIAWNVIKLQG